MSFNAVNPIENINKTKADKTLLSQRDGIASVVPPIAFVNGDTSMDGASGDSGEIEPIRNVVSKNVVFDNRCPADQTMDTNPNVSWGYVNNTYLLQLTSKFVMKDAYDMSITFSNISGCNTVLSFLLVNTQNLLIKIRSLSIQYGSSLTDIAKTTSGFHIGPHDFFLINIDATNNTLTVLPKTIDLNYPSLSCSDSNDSVNYFGYTWINSAIPETPQLVINDLKRNTTLRFLIAFQNYNNCTLSSFTVYNNTNYNLTVPEMSIQYSSSSTDIAKTTSEFTIDPYNIATINIDATTKTLTVLPNIIDLKFSALSCSDSNNSDTVSLENSSFTWTYSEIPGTQQLLINDLKGNITSSFLIAFQNYNNCTLSSFTVFNPNGYSLTVPEMSIQYSSSSTDIAKTTSEFTIDPYNIATINIDATTKTLTVLPNIIDLKFSALSCSDSNNSDTVSLENSSFTWTYSEIPGTQQLLINDLKGNITSSFLIAFQNYNNCNFSSFTVFNPNGHSFTVPKMSVQYSSSSTDIAKTTSEFTIDPYDIVTINIDATGKTLTVLPNTIDLKFSDLSCSDSNNNDTVYDNFTWSYSAFTGNPQQLVINDLKANTTLSFLIAFQNYNNCNLSSFTVYNPNDYSLTVPEMSIQYSSSSTDIAKTTSQFTIDPYEIVKITISATNNTLTLSDTSTLNLNFSALSCSADSSVTVYANFTWKYPGSSGGYVLEINSLTDSTQALWITFQNYNSCNLKNFTIVNNTAQEMQVKNMAIQYGPSSTDIVKTTYNAFYILRYSSYTAKINDNQIEITRLQN